MQRPTRSPAACLRKKKCPRSAPSKRNTSVSSERGRSETRISRQDCFRRSVSPEKQSVVKKQREAAALAKLKSFVKSIEAEERKPSASSRQTSTDLRPTTLALSSEKARGPRDSGAALGQASRRGGKSIWVGDSLAAQQLSGDDVLEAFKSEKERGARQGSLVHEHAMRSAADEKPSRDHQYVDEVESRAANLQRQV